MKKIRHILFQNSTTGLHCSVSVWSVNQQHVKQTQWHQKSSTHASWANVCRNTGVNVEEVSYNREIIRHLKRVGCDWQDCRTCLWKIVNSVCNKVISNWTPLHNIRKADILTSVKTGYNNKRKYLSGLRLKCFIDYKRNKNVNSPVIDEEQRH